MRRAVSLFCIVLIGAALAAAVARADSGSGTTTGTTDTTPTTTTDTTTTTATTTTQPTTTTTPTRTYAPLAASALPKGCVGAGVAAITMFGGGTVALALPRSGLGASEYPGSHPYLTFDSAYASGSGCTGAAVTLRNVSLFGGAVTATSVSARGGRGTAAGLKVNGIHVSASPGQTIAIGGWGLLTLGAASGRLSAPLELRLRYGHDAVPAGTTMFIGFAAQGEQPTRPVHKHVVHHGQHQHRRHRNGPHVAQPLKWTPPLGITTSAYVFPVDGGASYIDTYGAGRNDIYDGWHHGDDLFAPLGTPLVAVADGKLTLVGWNELGGWRLWVTDKRGNSFYYAHLSGYSRYILHHRHVHAGQVVGFLGRTGDAFTTPPHLHFEIHPHQLVRLGYDGAVDPTTYLQSWRVEHLPASKIPPAARLRAPAGAPSQEAAVVWGELLKARHLMPDGQPLVALTPSVRRPYPATRFIDARRLASSRLAGDSPRAVNAPWVPVALAVALAVLATVGSFAFFRRRRPA